MTTPLRENDRGDVSSGIAEDDNAHRGSQSRKAVVEAASGNSFNRGGNDDGAEGEGDVPAVEPRVHDQHNRSGGGNSELSSSPPSAQEYSSMCEFIQQQQRQHEIPANILERVLLRENLIASVLNTSTRASYPSSATQSLTRSLHDQFTRNDSSWPSQLNGGFDRASSSSNRQDESAALHGLAIQRLFADHTERQNQLAQQLIFRGDSRRQGLATQHQVDAQRSLTGVGPSRQPAGTASKPREDTHARSSSSYFSAGSTMQQTKNPGMEEGGTPTQEEGSGVSTIPCRARGMPKEHNFKVSESC
jgi:hypothetical protein